jgi:hypothetical protein
LPSKLKHTQLPKKNNADSLSQLETPDHVLFDCEEFYVMEQRSECDLANLHYQKPNNEDNFVHLLQDPENWSTICHFFNQLEIEV